MANKILTYYFRKKYDDSFLFGIIEQLGSSTGLYPVILKTLKTIYTPFEESQIITIHINDFKTKVLAIKGMFSIRYLYALGEQCNNNGGEEGELYVLIFFKS